MVRTWMKARIVPAWVCPWRSVMRATWRAAVVVFGNPSAGEPGRSAGGAVEGRPSFRASVPRMRGFAAAVVPLVWLCGRQGDRGGSKTGRRYQRQR